VLLERALTGLDLAAEAALLASASHIAPPPLAKLPQLGRPLVSGLDAVLLLHSSDDALMLQRVLGSRLDPVTGEPDWLGVSAASKLLRHAGCTCTMGGHSTHTSPAPFKQGACITWISIHRQQTAPASQSAWCLWQGRTLDLHRCAQGAWLGGWGRPLKD
jgi:hypothetical protein